MGKKFWLSVLSTFIIVHLLEVFLHGVILDSFYKNNPQGLLPVELSQQRMIWITIGYLILAFLWVYFFNRFASKKDLWRGIHHGVSYMIFLHVPLSFVSYAVFNVSGYIYLFWLIGGIVEGVMAGALMGIIMREKTT
jgi:hypothetical protein